MVGQGSGAAGVAYVFQYDRGKCYIISVKNSMAPSIPETLIFLVINPTDDRFNKHLLRYFRTESFEKTKINAIFIEKRKR